MTFTDTHTRFGHRLRSLRAARGWSMTELGDRSGLSRSGLYHLERGSSNPPLDVLCRLAAGLGIDLLTLLDFEPQPEEDARGWAEPFRDVTMELAELRDVVAALEEALTRLRWAELRRREAAR